MDTTLWELDNGTKAFIAFVSDNFSKMIIGWSLNLQNKAANIKQALDHAIRHIHQHYPDQISSTLVADGGSENHAATINELLNRNDQPKITKVVALKDISFSNSPVEAINKIMKRYLRHHTATTYDQLHKLLPEIIKDYNEIRPHGSLEGLTPIEAYNNPTKILNFADQLNSARKLRIAQNQKENCSDTGLNC